MLAIAVTVPLAFASPISGSADSRWRTIFSVYVLLSMLILVGCGGSGGSSSDDTANDNDTGPDSGIDNDTAGYFDRTCFSLDLTSENRVNCTLENGSTTTCYQLTCLASGAGFTDKEKPPDVTIAEAGVGGSG